jgi:hypothetical protein
MKVPHMIAAFWVVCFISCTTRRQPIWINTDNITIAKQITGGRTNYIIGFIFGAPEPPFEYFKERAYVTRHRLPDARKWIEAKKVELARMVCATPDMFDPPATNLVRFTIEEYLYLTESGGLLELRVRQYEPIAIAKEVANGNTNYFVGYTYNGAEVGRSFEAFKAHAYVSLPRLALARTWIESNKVNMAQLFCATSTTFNPAATNVVAFSPEDYRYLFRKIKTFRTTKTP